MSYGGQKSQRERLQAQGAALIQERRQKIDQLNQQIDEAEKELAKIRGLSALKYQELQEMIRAKREENEKNLEEESDNEQLSQEQNEINEILAKNAKEIADSRQVFNEEIKSLKEQYQEKTKAAEDWANEHVEALVHQKEIALNQLEQELQCAINDRNTSKMKNSKTYGNIQDQLDKASAQNENRAKYLQEEISKIGQSTREEVRDVKNKINETIATIQITEIEQETALKKYEKEIADRQKVYDDCLNSLNAQFSAEKKHIEKSMEIAVAQAQSAVSVQKKLEKFHEKQLQTTRLDTERLRTALTVTKTKDNSSLQITQEVATKVQEVRRQCDEVERDDMLICDEIKELAEENEDLEAEYNRLTQILYNSSYEI